jgi:hypothetical protein
MADICADTERFSGSWAKVHNAACDRPGRKEKPIVMACHALRLYAERHREAYGIAVCEDGVIGPAWLAMVRGVRVLLNGETGSLDCGTIDAYLCDLAAENGHEGEQ